MRTLLALVLFTAAGWAATSTSPSGCSTHPCIYTITCAASSCTGTEAAEVQTALNLARRGDTIRLQAGRVFSLGSGIGWTISPRTGTGYLTLTTTCNELEGGSLPSGCAGVLPTSNLTRITPHFQSLMPVIRSAARAVFVQCGPPADGIRLRGLIFEAQDGAASLLTLGCPPGGLAGHTATSDASLPTDLIVEQSIVRPSDWGSNRNMGALISFTSANTIIRSNWTAGARRYLGETNNITSTFGIGPYDIINNYIGDAAGESIFWGGTGADYCCPSPFGSVILNAVYNHPERLAGTNSQSGLSSWQANTVVFEGRYIRQSSYWRRATNSGTTGGSSPSWCSSVGCTTSDNGVVWVAVDSASKPNSSANYQLVLKNLYESKNSHDMTVAWNQFRGYTNQSQVQAIGAKISNYSSTTSQGQRAPYMTGICNTSGTVVTSADGNPLPKMHHPDGTQPSNSVAMVIRINGVQYTIARGSNSSPPVGDFPTDAQVGGNSDRILWLTTSAGNQSNVKWEFNWTRMGDRRSLAKNTRYMFNIIEDSTQAMQFGIQPDGADRDSIRGVTISNNLIRDIDCNIWGGCGGLGVNGAMLMSGGFIDGVFRNNTILSTNNPQGTVHSLNTTFQQATGFPRSVINNIVEKASSTGRAFSWNGTESNSALRAQICDSSACSSRQWGNNVVAGIASSTYTDGGPIYTLCPTSAACSLSASSWNPLFVDWGRGILKVKSTHAANRGLEGVPVGADYQMLPLIRNPITSQEGPSVRTTNNSAILEWWDHDPLVAYDLACSAEISTSRDMEGWVSVSDPNTLTDIHPSYPREGNLRQIRVGGLSPSTTYWYRLHCGPIYEGSFTTRASAGSAGQVTLSFGASATTLYRIVYGASYSRPSDTLSSGGAGGFVSCTSGQSCTLTATLPAGISWYRVESSGGSHLPLQTSVR